MAAETMLHPTHTAARSTIPVSACLLIGALCSLLAVGARWDVPLAAWIAPVLLLRFVRDVSAASGISAVSVVSLAAVLWWNVQLGVPMNGTTIAFAVVLGAIFALPFALDSWLHARSATLGRILLLPLSMVSCEYVVGAFSPLGTSYGLRAVTQSDNLALLQVISVTGPWGIALLLGLNATILNHAWTLDDRRRALCVVGVWLACLALVVAAGEARLAFAGTDEGSPRVKIAGITPEISARNAAKDAATREQVARHIADPAAVPLRDVLARNTAIHDELLARTREAARAGAKMVVWSETAAPALAEQVPGLLRRASALAREAGIYINVAVGVPFARNETYLIDPAGRTRWVYHKRHPVPGLEPVPPSNDAISTVDTPFGRLANAICFDADFPSLMRVRADVMLVPGWDWPEIGRTHTLKMARLRAIENGYALVRIAYDSESAAFDAVGNLLGRQDTSRRGSGHVLIVDVPMQGAWTPYSAIGDLLAWACVAGTVVLVGVCLRRRHTWPGTRPRSP